MNKVYNPIKVVIADDHELIRDGFTVMASRLSEFELVGEAENGEELVKLCRKLKPDIVITDVMMPKMDGIEATKKIKEEFPFIGVIALSMFDDENLIIDMLDAGAKGYLIKNAHKSEIVEAVKTVYQDRVYYCNHTTKKLAIMIASKKYHPHKKIAKPTFTERELQIIRLIAEGLASKEIADKLGLKKRTVESYREHVLHKMEVSNTAGLIIYAIRNKIISVD
ncbi:MAG: response regulator [Flavisolibacter sp.]